MAIALRDRTGTSRTVAKVKKQRVSETAWSSVTRVRIQTYSKDGRSPEPTSLREPDRGKKLSFSQVADVSRRVATTGARRCGGRPVL
mmetsp:Transcript_4974/g.15504  ORF Transcript_4974/g.15504 Transcript_4974/m.15504 type:complete len:87 (+) Transcript_4974:430-690(+)